MKALEPLIEQLQSGESLSQDGAEVAARLLAEEAVSNEAKKAFLIALAEKGETVLEVASFARVFRSLALNPGLEDWAARGIDIVGTGGSGSGGYNISSVTAFVVAAAGVPVLKHGNRAITSQSGSADFLGMAGISLESDPDRLRKSLEALNFCFFFAPAFHPAFKHIMPVRKEMAAEGKRSVFNILGPLINPAAPRAQLLGVSSLNWLEPLAASLSELGLARGLTVHCELSDGRRMDELTTAGVNHLAGMGDLADLRISKSPEDWGFVRTNPDQLKGAEAEANWQLFQDILVGRGRSGLVDTIVLNAAAALWVAEKVESLESGLALARELLLGGAVRDWVTRARAFYQEASQ